MSRWSLLTAALLLATASSPLHAAAISDSVTVTAAAHAIVPDVSNGVPGRLWTLFDERMRGALKDSLTWVQAQNTMHAQMGALRAIERERVVETRGVWTWIARTSFEKMPVPIDLMASFTADGQIAGLLMRPAQDEKPKAYASPNLEYVTKTALHLPFRGTWDVVWGGRTIEQNYHAAYRDQRFAHDILIMKDGSTHRGDGKSLSDYYCYGQPVLAPGAGRIVWLCDSLPDNAPGQRDPAHATGNSVVIDHGNGEYSLIAHMQPHSLEVRLGDKVNAGQAIGLCGNSGNTSEPHVHYHLQDTPRPFDGEGLPVQFTGLVVDGKSVARAEVIKGQKIANAR